MLSLFLSLIQHDQRIHFTFQETDWSSILLRSCLYCWFITLVSMVYQWRNEQHIIFLFGMLYVLSREFYFLLELPKLLYFT